MSPLFLFRCTGSGPLSFYLIKSAVILNEFLYNIFFRWQFDFLGEIGNGFVGSFLSKSAFVK